MSSCRPGIELIGAEAPAGTVDVLEVLCAALDAGGLPRARIGLGDAGLFRGLLRGDGGRRRTTARRSMDALERHDLVELEQRVERAADHRRAASARSSACRSCAAART